ncbi:site-specific integrase [Dietzia timorensis]|uniref:site-specific integrase n=1 Tax=Dietzia timorensis TaxID=499555 RepID=UPI001E42544F|nr:site-specific integrase [Dietzia timorensis]
MITESVTLGQTEELSDLMPMYFRPVVWIQRLAGLRTAEVFGLRVENVLLDKGFLQVRRQGGKRILVGEDDATTSVVTQTEDLKTPHSRRDVPIPRSLVELLRDYIEQNFEHEAGATQQLFQNPASEQNRASTYRTNLKRAARQIGLIDSNGNALTPHGLRKSYSTDLRSGGILGFFHSRVLGHKVRAFDGGAEVTASRYTLSPTQARLLEIAQLMDSLVDEAGVDVSLNSPWDVSPKRALTYVEAARILDIESLVTIWKLLSSGKLESAGPSMLSTRKRRYITLSSVMALRSVARSAIYTSDVQKETGASSMTLQTIKKDYNIVTSPTDLSEGAHVWTQSQVDLVKSIMAERNQRREEGMSLTEAAAALGTSPETVRLLIGAGALEQLPNMPRVTRGSVKWVTRKSVEEYEKNFGPKDKKRLKAQLTPSGCMRYMEATERLGLSKPGSITQFINAGRLTQVRVRNSTARFVTISSVEVLASELASPGITKEEPVEYHLTLNRVAAQNCISRGALLAHLDKLGMKPMRIPYNGRSIHALSVTQAKAVQKSLSKTLQGKRPSSIEYLRPHPDHLSIEEAAENMKLRPETLLELIEDGELIGTLAVQHAGGQHWFLPPEVISNFLARRRR